MPIESEASDGGPALKPSHWRSVRRYGFATLVVVGVLAFRLSLASYIGAHSPFFLFPLALVLASWLAGVGPGLLATFAAALASAYFFLGPIYPFGAEQSVNAVDLSLFSLEGIFIVCVFGVVRNRAQQLKSLNEQLLQSREELLKATQAAETASKTKTYFLANMSHEIRTPLSAVLGFSELLVMPDQSKDDRKSWVAAIKRNGNLLSSIIADILDLSKIEAGRIEFVKTSVAPIEVLKDVAALVNLQAREKGLRITTRIDPATPAVIRTDDLRLRQILLNIIGNAVKFTEKGSIEITVAKAGTKLMFQVKDTGIGISEEQAAKLFDAFSQADSSTTRRFGGTGLGLALAKRLAQGLGGDVELTAGALGVGSTFTITIDAGEPLDAQARESLVKDSDGASTGDVKGAKVLLVEDNEDSRRLIRHFLELDGVTVSTADNGRDGVAAALAATPDVILMDIQMPVMDGIEAVRVLREAGCQTPIIALTAHAFREERERCLAAGFNEHVPKPVDRKYLRQVLAHYSARQAVGGTQARH